MSNTTHHERGTVFCRPINLDDDYQVPNFPKTPKQIDFLNSVLQDNFIFTDLEEDERRQFVGAMQSEEVTKGTKIIQQVSNSDFKL